MLHPLASLWRHSSRVTFYESGGQAGQLALQGQGRMPGARRRFSSSDDAHTYLRYWLGEPAARAELQWILQRSGPSLATAQPGADAWLHALAGRLMSGAVIVLEELSRQARPGRLVAPASAAAAPSSLPALSEAPAIPVVPNLLPVLEDIRIEGAEVLPELNQALAQVDATIATVGSASLSLEPAPSKVAAIKTALTDATSRTTSTLGSL
ncbi:hypothetical protein GTP81_14570 [Rugamonas sp. FT107W]|uniref:Uncharacterized protein n=2 Tax=Duganella vulcania TaxID=2692166 RepID=A0A845HGV3_9BURK|nr:hypothetical protein [Duganella vulcania]MYN17981.1 hypothetical protein [Duganella vulcania]